MKKVFFVVILVAVLATGTAFADHPGGLGIGIQGGGGFGWGGGFGDGNAALSLKIPSLPIFWAIRMNIGGGAFGLGVSGDYYFIDSALPVPTLHWYLGFGVGVGLWGFNDAFGFGASARIPIGLSWQPIKFLEIFLQAVPNLGVQFLPSFYFPSGGVGLDLGIRIWF
jgi:hypothetical protein